MVKIKNNYETKTNEKEQWKETFGGENVAPKKIQVATNTKIYKELG